MEKKINSIKIFLLCPVPEDQKPITEYIQLKKYLEKKEKILDHTQNKNEFNSPFLQEFDSFFHFFNPLKIEQLGKMFFNFFLIIRWKELETRLTQAIVFYEESSWYDGQIWEKPFSILKNDRLLSTQIVQPILKKTLFSFFCTILFLIFTQF